MSLTKRLDWLEARTWPAGKRGGFDFNITAEELRDIAKHILRSFDTADLSENEREITRYCLEHFADDDEIVQRAKILLGEQERIV